LGYRRDEWGEAYIDVDDWTDWIEIPIQEIKKSEPPHDDPKDQIEDLRNIIQYYQGQLGLKINE